MATLNVREVYSVSLAHLADKQFRRTLALFSCFTQKWTTIRRRSAIRRTRQRTTHFSTRVRKGSRLTRSRGSSLCRKNSPHSVVTSCTSQLRVPFRSSAAPRRPDYATTLSQGLPFRLASGTISSPCQDEPPIQGSNASGSVVAALSAVPMSPTPAVLLAGTGAALAQVFAAMPRLRGIQVHHPVLTILTLVLPGHQQCKARAQAGPETAQYPHFRLVQC